MRETRDRDSFVADGFDHARGHGTGAGETLDGAPSEDARAVHVRIYVRHHNTDWDAERIVGRRRGVPAKAVHAQRARRKGARSAGPHPGDDRKLIAGMPHFYLVSGGFGFGLSVAAGGLAASLGLAIATMLSTLNFL